MWKIQLFSVGIDFDMNLSHKNPPSTKLSLKLPYQLSFDIRFYLVQLQMIISPNI